MENTLLYLNWGFCIFVLIKIMFIFIIEFLTLFISMSYLFGRYISKEGLENIKNHKYIPGVYSKIDYMMEPFWKWCTELLPMSMAPNTVTLVGFLALWGAYFCMALCDMSMLSYPPPWTWFLTAAGMFIFQTFDAMDGKQARRTNSSSPLGQLFDHGLDGTSLSLCSLTLVSLFGCGLSTEGVFWMMFVWTPLFSLHLLEYYTGVFEYTIGNIDGTLGYLIAVMLNFLPSIFGKNFYNIKLKEIFWFLPSFIYSSSEYVWDILGLSNVMTRELIVRDIGMIYVVIGSVGFSTIVVYCLLDSQKSIKMKMVALFQLFQQICCYFILFSFDTKIEFIRDNSVLCYMMAIFMYNILQTKLVICLMAKMKFFPLHLEYIVFSIYFYFQYKYDGSNESLRNLKLGFYTTFVILGILYFRLFQSCISQLTEYLGIECFVALKIYSLPPW